MIPAETLESLQRVITPDYLSTIRTVLFIVLLLLTIYYLINIGNNYVRKSLRIEINTGKLTKLGIFIVGFLLLRYLFLHFPIIGNTLGVLIISAVMAYIINPVVSGLQSKGLQRPLGVLIVYVSFLLFFVILLIVVLPRSIEEIQNLFKALPQITEQVNSWVWKQSEVIGKETNIDTARIIMSFQDQVDKFFTEFETQFASRIRDLVTGMYSAMGKVVSFVLILVLTYYFTVDKDRIKVRIYKAIPSDYRSDLLYLAGEINRALMAFIKGKLVLAFFVGLATAIMLLILRVEFAVVIGMITMVADIIPYIGPTLGFIPAFFFALIDSKVKAIFVAILFVFLQWAENNIMAPRIIGNRTGLHPIVVLLCIVVGGGMYGFIGMIISVPLVSVALIIKDFIIMKITQRKEREEAIRKMQ